MTGARRIIVGMSIEMPEPLLRTDHDPDNLLTRLRDGELQRVAPGIFLPAFEPDVPAWQRRRQRHLALAIGAGRRLGNRAVLSHSTAAVLHGLWIDPGPAVHVTHPFHERLAARPDGTWVRHNRPLTGDDVVEIEGLRCTSLDRTVLDCIAGLAAPSALAVIDSALRRLISVDRREPERAAEAAEPILRDWARRVERDGPRRGRRRARAIVAAADPLSESALESRARCAALADGLPRPVLQRQVSTHLGEVYTDASWIDRLGAGRARFVHMEADGEVKYDTVGDAAAPERTVFAEKRREDAIRERGDAVLRVTNDDLTQARHLRLGGRIRSLFIGEPVPLEPRPYLAWPAAPYWRAA